MNQPERTPDRPSLLTHAGFRPGSTPSQFLMDLTTPKHSLLPHSIGPAPALQGTRQGLHGLLLPNVTGPSSRTQGVTSTAFPVAADDRLETTAGPEPITPARLLAPDEGGVARQSSSGVPAQTPTPSSKMTPVMDRLYGRTFLIVGISRLRNRQRFRGTPRARFPPTRTGGAP